MNIKNMAVKLSGIHLSTTHGSGVDIDSLEISGSYSDVVKTLGLFAPHAPARGANTVALPAIGSIYDGDIVGAHMVDGGEVYALLVAGEDAERELAWASKYEDTGATSFSDGLANTQRLFSFSENKSYHAARYCVEYNGGGYHLPSRLELSLIAANSEAVEAAKLDGWYWTSAQISESCAGIQYFSNGNQGTGTKTNVHKVRPIRRVKL